MRNICRYAVALVGLSALISAEPLKAAPERAKPRAPAAAKPSGPAWLAGVKPAGADVVLVESLTVSSSAAAGASVPVSMLIKNVSTSARDVPWRIVRNDQILGFGTVTVAAGATATVGTTWPSAAVGQHWVYVDVDPDNTFREAIANHKNNTRGNALSVAAPAQQPTPPVLETQELDFAKVKAAGGRSGSQNPIVTVCAAADLSNCAAGRPNGRVGTGALFSGQAGLLGLRDDAEAYKGFQLKNGWRVKEVLEPVVTSASGNRAGWGYAAFSNAGTTSPYIKMHLWAEGPLGTGVNNEIVLIVRTMIEGPAGTNPYQ
jgi:hypothetical protein